MSSFTNMDLASGYVNIAIGNGPVEIVDLPSYKVVDLSSSLCKRLPGRVDENG